MNKEKLVKCGCGGEPLLEPRYIRMNVYYALRCPCCGIEIRRKTEAEAITAWNKAMDKQVAVVKNFGHPCGVYGYCSNCGGYCVNEEPYCPHCGAKVEWE